MLQWSHLANPAEAGAVYVGPLLRAALIEQIEAFTWGAEQAGMDRVRAALDVAPRWRGGYRLDLERLVNSEEDLLDSLTQAIRNEALQTARSRGLVRSGPLMGELRRFRSAMGWD